MTNLKLNNKKVFKLVAVGCFTAVLIAIFGFRFYINAKSTERELNLEKVQIITKLNKSKDSIALIINDNIFLKSELLIQQQKITNLINKLQTADTNLENLEGYKSEIEQLRKEVSILQKDKSELVKKYNLLKSSQDSTLVVLESTNKKKDRIEELNINMNKISKKSARVAFASLKIETLHKSKNGKSTVTENSNRANFLNLNFAVIGNNETMPIEKEFYVQIIDPKNNIIGNRLSKKFGALILDYSYVSKFSYVDTSLEVKSGIDIVNAQKGTYFVNIFDKEKLVLKSSFDLK